MCINCSRLLPPCWCWCCGDDLWLCSTACLPACRRPPHAQSAAALLCLESSMSCTPCAYGCRRRRWVHALRVTLGVESDTMKWYAMVHGRRCCALEELEYGVAVDATGHAIRNMVLFVRECVCRCASYARTNTVNHRGTCTQLVIGATCARHPQPSLHYSCCSLTLDPSQ